MTVAAVLFWISVMALFHSYVLYPLLLKLLTQGKKQNQEVFTRETAPLVSVLIPAFNEEKAIGQKIKSVFECGYPESKLQVLVGSDFSTDGTNAIVMDCAKRYGKVELVEFQKRTGKVVIVNELVKKATGEILVLTDANVIFGKDALFQMVKHFRNSEISLVDSNMVNTGKQKDSIAFQEKTYISAEVGIKHAEGLLAGCMMGPFGGCYAIRKTRFTPVPAHFLVDDFYINMCVIESGDRCINELNAVVYEEVSHGLIEEVRRKTRIATGNFQNLDAFKKLLLRFNTVSFCFLSHKVLRWAGPLFLLTALASNLYLSNVPFYLTVLYLQAAFYAIPVLDAVFSRLGIHLAVFRFVTHLLAMNLALLAGMVRYTRGVESSIWQPTRRGA